MHNPLNSVSRRKINFLALLSLLFAVAEAYPELKASDNFAKLQQDLSDTENKIAYSRQFYNDTTMKYNTKFRHFPEMCWLA